MKNTESLKIAVCQMSPIWLNKKKTTKKMLSKIEEAAKEKPDLIVFGEALLPGYPFWVELTDGARFNNETQKEFFAKYLKEGVDIEAGDLDEFCAAAKKYKMAMYIGCMERPSDRGGHTFYCTLVFIDKKGAIKSVHRKLMPTYEERMVWGQGDGNGLQVHQMGDFKIGGLNCWENWLPLARTALYLQGENVHVATWPGQLRNTENLTRHIAEESRSYSIGVSGFMRKKDIPKDFPNYDLLIKNAPKIMANGGSCIADPTGKWLVEPVVGKEAIFYAELDHKLIRKERQNLDLAGHYSRPDILKLKVNRERQTGLEM